MVFSCLLPTKIVVSNYEVIIRKIRSVRKNGIQIIHWKNCKNNLNFQLFIGFILINLYHSTGIADT